jgi:hypothetical protein
VVAPTTRHWRPPSFTTARNAVPRTALVLRGETFNARWTQVEGVFEEILPDWDYAPTTPEP